MVETKKQNKTKSIKLLCLNVRGLRNKNKRSAIFNWLKNNHHGITLLQETHSTLTDEQKWIAEWDGIGYFSHGDFNARGVATLIPKNYLDDFEHLTCSKDKSGRLLTIKCKIDSLEFTIINIYSPTKDNLKSQLEFSHQINEILNKHHDNNIILGGDLNTYLSNLDKKGGKIENPTKYTDKINELCEIYGLTDIWRNRNPTLMYYTRREKSKIGLIQSRLDYFLTSTKLNYLITEISIKPSIHTDHSLLTLSIDLIHTNKRGKGMWKFNNDLLTDNIYTDQIKDIIANTIQTETTLNKNNLWEFLKCTIRTHTIEYSIKRNKELRKKEKEIMAKLEEYEQKIDNTIELEEYKQIKREYEHILDRKIRGQIIRAKAVWTEEGEKNSKYFLNLEKHNYEIKHIKKLISTNNEEITDPEKILEEEKIFYEHLYTSKINNSKEISDFCSNELIPKISSENKTILNEPLNIEECTTALKMLPNNKSPGPDGFTTNFLKKIWPELKNVYFESLEHSFQNDCLTQSQKLCVLNIIPKEGKDLRHLSNWRPISLLNTDYKLLTKVLAVRLQKIIPELINTDQVGYIKKRFIGQNIRTLFDILQYAKLENIEAYLTQIDFEKAFDSIEWDFLIKTLKAFDLGDYFINWINIIYTDISACVSNNGYYSKYFKLSRAIRQGCPVSALLFLFVAEIIAIKIRNNKHIQGIKIDKVIYKIFMMADDTTIATTNLESLKIAINDFKNFETFSGLKLNLSKTEIIPLGKMSNTIPLIPPDLKQVKVTQLPFKALGTWFSTNETEILTLNTKERLKKMNTTLNIWISRNLSLLGKITIIKSLILPQISFMFALIYIPKSILEQIDKMLNNFLWNGKPAKIKKSTIIAPIEKGGLRMPDVNAIHLASKINWYQRLNDDTNSKWKNTMLYMLNINKDLLHRPLNQKWYSVCKTSFHKQLLESWQIIHNNPSYNVKTILNQHLTHNRFITIDNKELKPENIRCINSQKLKIIDVYDINKTIKSYENFRITNGANLNNLEYNSIVSAIPQNWKQTIKNSTVDIINLKNEECYIYLENKTKPIILQKLTNKLMYQSIIHPSLKPATAIDTWINIFPFMETQDWKNIYTLTRKLTTETYLHTFQYKIINRIINCRDRLHKWSPTDNNTCQYCDKIDTLEHHLYECRESKALLNKIEKWLHHTLEILHNFTICETIFGIPNRQEQHFYILNYIVLIYKLYINKAKTNQEPISMINYLIELKCRIEILNTNNIDKIGNIIKDNNWTQTIMDVL